MKTKTIKLDEKSLKRLIEIVREIEDEMDNAKSSPPLDLVDFRASFYH
ncbi:MAG: hypothetical protein HRU19_25585 [Pseudobacteriovorax sp.]|nr:hypothetical protein [Pseudobacteriovorax sp.]